MLLSKLLISLNNNTIYLIGGAILGLTFFALYYPLVAHTYNQLLPNQKPLWPSLTISVYFEMIGNIYPLVALPGLTMGILGAILAYRVKPNKIQTAQS
jgi:esterase/lipase